MDVTTNTFCAGGSSLGDGRWLVVGGNQAVLPGGDALPTGGTNPYGNGDGGQSVRSVYKFCVLLFCFSPNVPFRSQHFKTLL